MSPAEVSLYLGALFVVAGLYAALVEHREGGLWFVSVGVSVWVWTPVAAAWAGTA